MNLKNHILLKDLEVYQCAQQLSDIGWSIYEKLDWKLKKIIGDQFITSTDSVGANIAEGYGRYHYLDKIKFLYNSRGSLFEANNHWVELMKRRNMVESKEYEVYIIVAGNVSAKLQNFINAIYRTKNRIS